MKYHPHTIQCLDRAMDILLTIASEKEMGISELARKLGLQVPTTSNILRTLAVRNFLLNNDGRYSLGPAIGILSNRWNPMAALPDLVRPLMENITKKVGETCICTILSGSRLVMVLRVLDSNEVTVQYPPKNLGNPLAMVTGEVLVSHLDKSTWDFYIKHSLEFHQVTCSKHRQQSKELYKRLEIIYAQGYSQRFANKSIKASAVAAPVFIGSGRAVAAIGASCPAERSTKSHIKKMLDAVTHAAEKLSNELNQV